MENKQKQIDDLLGVIDRRIEINERVMNIAARDAANAADNVRFSRFVKAKVQEILGIEGKKKDGGCAVTAASASGPLLNLRNECGRPAKSGDVVMSDSIVTLVTKREKFKEWHEKGYIPIGVYVIASNGETGMLSLVNMSCDTPEDGDEKGNGEGRFIRYGGYGSHVEGLKSYGVEDAYQKVIDRTFRDNGHGSYGYLPSDKFAGEGGAKSQIDGKRYYYDDGDNLLPVPFLADGVVNPLFGKGKNQPSFLSDGDSRANTDALIKDATAQADWRTAEKIINERGAGYHPAACCCRRFHTIGTKAGDWDLPAIPVLACAFVEWDAVQGTLKELAKDGFAVPLDESDGYWSSSEYSQNLAYGLLTNYGNVYNYNKTSYHLVRAFCRLPRI